MGATVVPEVSLGTGKLAAEMCGAEKEGFTPAIATCTRIQSPLFEPSHFLLLNIYQQNGWHRSEETYKTSKKQGSQTEIGKKKNNMQAVQSFTTGSVER